MNDLPSSEDMATRLLGSSEINLRDEERRVLAAIASGTISSRDRNALGSTRSTYGERLSDRVAAIGGSWGFIIAFAVVLLGWMMLNTGVLQRFGEAFDPYPYIFLNLMLSTVAAIQAPIIMMSQNRQSAKDRVAAQLDYETNLRAELELLRLHHKIDALEVLRLHQKLDLLLAREERGPIEAGDQAG